MKFIYSLLEIAFFPLSFLFRIIGYSAFIAKESLVHGWKEGWLLQQEAYDKIKNREKQS